MKYKHDRSKRHTFSNGEILNHTAEYISDVICTCKSSLISAIQCADLTLDTLTDRGVTEDQEHMKMAKIMFEIAQHTYDLIKDIPTIGDDSN